MAEKQMILMIRIPLLLMATILHDLGDCYDSDESDDGDNSDDKNTMVPMRSNLGKNLATAAAARRHTCIRLNEKEHAPELYISNS